MTIPDAFNVTEDVNNKTLNVKLIQHEEAPYTITNFTWKPVSINEDGSELKLQLYFGNQTVFVSESSIDRLAISFPQTQPPVFVSQQTGAIRDNFVLIERIPQQMGSIGFAKAIEAAGAPSS